MAAVEKVQALLDLPLDNEDRYSGFDDMSVLPTSNQTIHDSLPTIQ